MAGWGRTLACPSPGLLGHVGEEWRHVPRPHRSRSRRQVTPWARGAPYASKRDRESLDRRAGRVRLGDSRASDDDQHMDTTRAPSCRAHSSDHGRAIRGHRGSCCVPHRRGRGAGFSWLGRGCAAWQAAPGVESDERAGPAPHRDASVSSVARVHDPVLPWGRSDCTPGRVLRRGQAAANLTVVVSGPHPDDQRLPARRWETFLPDVMIGERLGGHA